MSSRFWASSEDVSTESVDSSIASLSDGARDFSRRQSGKEVGQEQPQNRDTAVVAHAAATNSVALSELQPYERANLFYLSLIEGRCRTQAATAINANRDAENKLEEDHPEVLDLSRHMFDEMRQELVKAGMLSEEFASGELPQLHTYLTSFDNILGNIATQQTHNLAERHMQPVSNDPEFLILDSNRSIANASNALIQRQLAQQFPRAAPNTLGTQLLRENTSLFNPSNSLIHRGFFVAPDNFPMVLTKSFQTLLRNIFPHEDHSKEVSTVSNYVTDYTRLCKLGSGGYGAVYKVRNKYDQAEYAVKKIIVKRETIQRLYDQDNIGELTSLIKEVQTLAKLQHHNVVVYHHCWMEPRPLDENISSGSSSSEDDESQLTSENASFAPFSMASLSISNENKLQRDTKAQRRRATSNISADVAADIDIGRVFFANDGSVGGSRNTNSNNDHDETDSSDEDDEEDTEEIERLDGQIVRSPKKHLKHAEFDLVLYIKMAPYPMSLHQFIKTCSENSSENQYDAPNIQHCYHVLPTIRLLLSILDGVEYIHRKNIIHRDLKPANILLQILDASEVPTQGFVNISDCRSCPNTKPTWISPRIGDFGLIHDLSAPPPEIPPSGANMYKRDSSTAPGTAAYLPPGLRNSSPVCTKLDVYSLGIIAFEMSYKFGTSTERFIVLDRLKKSGEVPENFRNHVLKDCILNMVNQDVESRWDCPTVRRCLESILSAL